LRLIHQPHRHTQAGTHWLAGCSDTAVVQSTVWRSVLRTATKPMLSPRVCGGLYWTLQVHVLGMIQSLCLTAKISVIAS